MRSACRPSSGCAPGLRWSPPSRHCSSSKPRPARSAPERPEPMWEVRVTPAGDFDNHAFKSNHFEVRPLSAAMGAEVVGVRLPDLSDEAFEQFKQALYRHKMLFLRDQFLTHAEHE